jgi:integrase
MRAWLRSRTPLGCKLATPAIRLSVGERSRGSCGRFADRLADFEAGRLLIRRTIAKKESTLISDRGRIARHIIPVLGRMPVKVVRRMTSERFMHDVAAGKRPQGRRPSHAVSRSYVAGAASPGAPRHCSARSSPMPCARAFGSTNPVHGIVRFAEGRRQRRLSNDEYRMLGMALSRSGQEKVWQSAIAATWLMILTGWRRGEVLGLRWSDIDLPRRQPVR